MRAYDDPATGLLLATAMFQAVTSFADAEGTPVGSIPVCEPAVWFAFYDSGAN